MTCIEGVMFLVTLAGSGGFALELASADSLLGFLLGFTAKYVRVMEASRDLLGKRVCL